MASTIDTLNIHWQCKHTWKRASYNTSWCLLGCSIGDLEAIVPLATQIRDWAEKTPAYFPAGSGGNHPKHPRKSGWIFRDLNVPPMPSIADDLVELRPDDPVYVKLGQKIYMDQCASCHGVSLEGLAGWRDTMVDGMRLAPPHDKSGHTWHHPDALLFKLTKYGFAAMIGSDYKVSMPVYDDMLKDEEIIAALSYIKTTWPDNVR